MSLQKRLQQYPLGLVLIATVVIIVLGTLPLTARCGEEPPVKSKPRSTAQLSKEFRLLKDWKERRAFCIELMDQEIVSRGTPVADVARIFDGNFYVITGDTVGTCRAIVLFEDQRTSNEEEDSEEARSFNGWYLRVESDAKGKIENYHLSNLHK